MVLIKEVSASAIKDSRKDKTILVTINTNVGKFSASAPNGKSKGKFEAKSYIKSLDDDIKTIKKFSDYFDEKIEEFEDLQKIEDIIQGGVGANTTFAFESAILKSLSFDRKKNIWQLVNPNAKIFPRLVGNCIGGGKHSSNSMTSKPDFQEFELVPNLKLAKESFELNKKIKNHIEAELKRIDNKFRNEKNDEDAWQTSLNEKQVLDLLKDYDVPLGLDVAASSFFKRKKYNYRNPLIKREKNEQFDYISNLIQNFNLFYIEDPFEENDFKSFAKLLKKFPKSLIVGDDLTVTNLLRLEKAIEEKSINAIIVKPNQNGSLIQVKKICELAKKKNIKIVFSHRSGETEENIIADLAFGFQADFIKTGITGKEREAKIKRLIEIEESLG